MNNLENLNKLYRRKKTYTKESDGETIVIEIEQLGMDNLSLLESTQEDKGKEVSLQEQTESMYKLISVSIGITVEDARKIAVDKIEWLMDCIIDLNNLDDMGKKRSDKIDKIKGLQKRMEKPKRENQ